MGEMRVSKFISTGCSEHDNCFTCPFPDCIMQGDNSGRVNKTQLIYDKIRRMSKNFSVTQIAIYFSISKRTVLRALEGGANE